MRARGIAMPVNDSVASDQWYRWRYCVERGHYKFLEKADKCDNYFAGIQWDEKDLNALALQRRPALTINKIISTLSTIMGEQIYNRNETLFRPSTGAQPATAEALSKLWMQISQNNQLPWVRSDVFADGIIRSRGFYDVRLDFNDAMQGEVRIKHQNSKNVVIDPDAEEYDPDSWSDVHITKWLTYQDIALLYNEDDAEYLKDRGASTFPFAYDSIERSRDRFAGTNMLNTYWGHMDNEGVRRNIRVLERQFHMLTSQKHFVDIATGDMRPIPDNWDRNKIASVLERAGGQVNVIGKKIKRVRSRITADHVVLHDEWMPFKHFTVVPYFPYFRHGRTVGIVENLLGPQEVLNKVTSQELHVVNTTANSGWKIKAGGLKNMTVEELELKGAQTGLVIELDDINSAEKIQPNQTPTGLDRISYKAEEHIKTISNVSDSMQGFDREDVAAKAIAYKAQRGSVNLTKVLDNLERTDWLLARNVLDIIQNFYTEERIVNITHDDITREPETLYVNQYDPATDEIVNDLTVGEYNIVITSQPYRASMEDSQFEQARALREIGVPIPDSVLIENSRLLRRGEIVKQMEGDKNSPEAQEAAELERRAKHAEVAKLEAEASKTGADAQLSGARAQSEVANDPQQAILMEMQKMREELRMERERLAMELQVKERELALKEQEMQMKLAHQQEEHQQNLAIKEQEAAQSAQMRQEESDARRAQMIREQSATDSAPTTKETT